MQNDLLKPTLSTLTNQFLNVSLVIFLFILFKYYFFICIFSKYHIFLTFRKKKKRYKERNNRRKF